MRLDVGLRCANPTYETGIYEANRGCGEVDFEYRRSG